MGLVNGGRDSRSRTAGESMTWGLSLWSACRGVICATGVSLRRLGDVDE